MAAGDTTAVILDLVDLAATAAAIEALRVTANDKFYITSTGPENQQVLVVHIEEAA